MIRFSANLGFLWSQLDLCESIHAASGAGFDAVECHWPYTDAPEDVAAALADAGIPMLVLNTRPGDLSADEFGVCALPDKQILAREYIDEALDYAVQIHCQNIHVMAGRTFGHDAAKYTYIENLSYACNQAKKFGITVLIEPINIYDVPGYHLHSIEAAIETLDWVKQDNLKIMFDCYHVQIMQGQVINQIRTCFKHIGHIQIASVPDRAEPDSGVLDYAAVINAVEALEYDGFLGAEYRPSGRTEENLGWLHTLKN